MDVLCEDLSVNGVLSAGKPLALSTWVGRMPLLADPTDWRAWAPAGAARLWRPATLCAGDVRLDRAERSWLWISSAQRRPSHWDKESPRESDALTL
jgi:hypothetical protein